MTVGWTVPYAPPQPVQFKLLRLAPVLLCTLALMSYPMQELWKLWPSKDSSHSQTVDGTMALEELLSVCDNYSEV
jgi:hypothetical protein